MRVLLFDPASGASGDMIIGCLLDLGADPGAVKEAVESVGCRLEISRERRHHLIATRARVTAEGRYQSLREARRILEGSSLEPPALDRALRIMDALAGAEAEVHGTDPDQARFHEIGALDALADIAGSCAALHSLEVEKILSLPISTGGGTVSSSHGLLPVPAPATLEMLRRSGLLWKGGPVNEELLTPTGAAILAIVVDEMAERYPLIRAEQVGYGTGARKLEIPNLLRCVVGDLVEGHFDEVAQLETNVDDVTGEVLGNLIGLLMEEGALDVSAVPALMKKGRYGNIIKVITRQDRMEKLAALLMRETGSLGVRIFPSLHRSVAGRESRALTIDIKGRTYQASVKVSWLGGETLNVKAEYEDCKKIASRSGLPLREVARRIEEKGWKVVDRSVTE